ncbi:MAG TPA: hypothetical protein VIL79_02245 [Thermoleophilia bacterium]
MAGRLRHTILIVAVIVVLCAAAAVALACVAAPARAFSDWAHDGATGCVCHDTGTPTDATCTACHAGFVSVPDKTCWSCHYPGQDTSSLASPSSACSQACHLYSPFYKAYTIAFTHGTNPHLGSTPACLDCHQTSAGIADPGQSPHHNGAQKFDACTVCHNGFQKHAGQVSCTACHATAVAFHLYQAPSPGFKNCRSCHAKKHAGKNVPQSKCATCHKGTGSGGAAQAQHSASITKKKVCSACHSKALHAKNRGSGITSCGRCHTGKFHAAQKSPPSSICKGCHTRAYRHSDGYACALCHRSAIHNARPRASLGF